jgi:DNA-binding NarL/FixJ family response regulator
MGGVGRTRANPEITVFLIADNQLVREVIARLLQKRGRIRLVGASAAAGLAWSKVAATRSKVVLAEGTALKDAPGLLHDLSANVPQSRLVIFGVYEDLDLFLRLISIRVSGYALSDVSVDRLVALIREVAENDTTAGPVVEHMDSHRLATDAAVHALPGADC